MGTAILDTLRLDILGGHPPPGDALPSERRLAQMHKVGRPAVREALRKLETLGLIHSRHGSGTVVTDWLRDGTLDLLPHYLAAGAPGADGRRLLRDILRLRVFPCSEVIRMASETAPDAAFADALDGVRHATSLSADPSAFALADLDIYRRLAAQTGSPLATWMLNTIVPVFRDLTRQMAGVVRPPRDYRSSMSDVLRTAQRGQGDLAVGKLQKYLERHDAGLLRRLGMKGRT